MNDMKALPLVASMLGDKLGVEVVIGDMKTASTDGKIIMLPALPLCAEEELAALVNGYIDHEAAHIRHTDFEAIKNSRLNPLEKHIENTIEDWRVEHEIVKRYPGCRDHFHWLIRHFFLNDMKAEEIDSPAFSLLDYILLTLRSWDVPELQPQVRANARIIDAYWPNLREKLDQILSKIPVACSSTRDSIRFSRKIVRLIKQEAADEILQPQEQTESGEGQNQSSSPSDSPVPLSSDSSGDDSADAQTSADSGVQDKNPSAPKTLSDLIMVRSSELPQSFDDQLAQSIHAAQPEADTKIGVAKEGHIDKAPLPEADIVQVSASSRALRTRLQGLLQSQVLRRSRPSRYGKVSGRDLFRLAANNPKIFKKHEEVQGIDTAVHLLLDVSGSMRSRLKLATLACFSVASALSSVAGINVGVTAFPAIEEHLDYISVCPLVRHGERVTNQFNITSHGTTPLTEALWWVTKKLLPLPEKRKLILLITDGEPDSETTAKASIREIERMGIEILGIGINSNHLADLISHQASITTMDELAPAMFSILQQALLKHRG